MGRDRSVYRTGVAEEKGVSETGSPFLVHLYHLGSYFCVQSSIRSDVFSINDL